MELVMVLFGITIHLSGIGHGKFIKNGVLHIKLWDGTQMNSESNFDKEFEVVLTKEDLKVYYGVYTDDDLDRID